MNIQSRTRKYGANGGTNVSRTYTKASANLPELVDSDIAFVAKNNFVVNLNFAFSADCTYYTIIISRLSRLTRHFTVRNETKQCLQGNYTVFMPITAQFRLKIQLEMFVCTDKHLAYMCFKSPKRVVTMMILCTCTGTAGAN